MAIDKCYFPDILKEALVQSIIMVISAKENKLQAYQCPARYVQNI